MTAGEKLKELRCEKGYTQDQVIEMLNEKISKNTLSNAENDKCKTKGSNDGTLTILAEFYNVNIEYLRNPQCMNRNIETINIGKHLNLSDKALNKIKGIGEHNYEIAFLTNYKKTTYVNQNVKNIFNSFIEDFNLNDFSYMLEELNDLIKIKQVAINILNFSNNMRTLIEKSDNNEILKKIDYYKREIKNYQNIINKNTLSSYSKFYSDYYNIVDFKEYLDDFEECYNNSSFKDCDIICGNTPDIGIEFITDAEREINILRYSINRLFENYIESLSTGIEEYNFQ